MGLGMAGLGGAGNGRFIERLIQTIYLSISYRVLLPHKFIGLHRCLVERSVHDT